MEKVKKEKGVKIKVDIIRKIIKTIPQRIITFTNHNIQKVLHTPVKGKDTHKISLGKLLWTLNQKFLTKKKKGGKIKKRERERANDDLNKQNDGKQSQPAAPKYLHFQKHHQHGYVN